MAQNMLVNSCHTPTAVLNPDSDYVRVMYSGINQGTMVMGDATVTAVRSGRLGMRGDHPVRKGMDLTLLIFLPKAEEPVSIAESRVSEVAGPHFDVELLSTALVSQAELEGHLRNVMEG